MYQYAIEWNSLLEKKKARVQIGNRAILVCIADGLPYAIADKCPHQGYPLSSGKYDNGIIQCKEHGLAINVRTGQVVDSPKVAFLKIAAQDRSVRSFPVKTEDGKVYIDL